LGKAKGRVRKEFCEHVARMPVGNSLWETLWTVFFRPSGFPAGLSMGKRSVPDFYSQIYL
jgi:hypothetical protein